MSEVFGPGTAPVVTDVGTTGEIEADVVVIGAGMGGGTLAHALRETGARVLLVEQGDFLPRELANWSPKAVHIDTRYKNSDPWYDELGNGFIPGNYHYVGGSTKLYGATLPRFREHDFDDIEHPDGVSPAWPLTYDDLERHYATAEQMFWVHGTKGEDPTEPWRSTDFPYPAVPHEPTMASLAQRVREQGLHPFALPQAIDLREGGNCVRCGTCDSFSCMVDAKGDADVGAVRPALRSPTVRLLTNTTVDRLETDPTGRQVVTALARHGGTPVRIRGGRFVVSAGAVHTAALLLRSSSEKHPAGLANGSDQVGRNYMAHLTTFFLGFHPVRRNEDVYTKTLGINDWYSSGPSTRYPLGNVQGLGKLQGAMVKGARKHIPLSVLNAATHRTVDLFLQSEDLPLSDSRVVLGTDNRITLHRKLSNQSSHDELLRRMTKVAHKAGYPKVLSEQLGTVATSHQCGTARMGVDPATSVVDPFCRSHELGNMWIVDSSPFVSSAAVNPALTIAALALRVAESGQLTS